MLCKFAQMPGVYSRSCHGCTALLDGVAGSDANIYEHANEDVLSKRGSFNGVRLEGVGQDSKQKALGSSDRFVPNVSITV